MDSTGKPNQNSSAIQLVVKFMSRISHYFRMARKAALKGDSKDASRQFRLGCIGIRSDGATVTSSNLPCRVPTKNAHAEARLTKKLDFGSTVYIARIRRDGKLTTARPCNNCQNIMRLRGVRCCFYSINESEFGIIRFP